MSSGFEIAPLDMNLGNVRHSAVVNGAEDPIPSQESFSQVLTVTGEQFVSSLQRAEAASIAGIKGEAGAYEVASAVMEAEQSLRMTVAIRDRLVQAFLEISRMQI